MDNVFDDILDADEKVVKIFKPKKSVVFVKNLLSVVFLFIFFSIFLFIGLLSDSEDKSGYLYILLGFLAFFVVVLLISIWFVSLYYKNVFYCYTNKRIIVRKGIFGVDYHSLDIKMIGASNVNVTLLDKLLRKNTGTISFGSTSSPLVNANNVTNFTFANIENPYELYKEIKNYISDSSKKQD